MDALTGAAIAKLAFDEFVKSGAGEVAKKAVGGAIEQLRSTIRKRFAGNQKAEAVIVKIEQERSPEALNKLSVYLEDEMEDLQFAQTLQQLAQQVVNIQNQSISNRQSINYGRDQINIETIQGNPRIGGS
jgi:predicted ATP-dependent Lon-type protease